MKNNKILLLGVLLTLSRPGGLQAQQPTEIPPVLTLERAIEVATVQSPQARAARLSFIGRYWNYRSYRAELLPSFNLSGSALNYDRSIVDVRNAETGEISYVSNNSLSNNLSLSINQNIPLLGGSLSVSSNLSRLDQFDYDRTNYNSNPLSVSYTQPLRSYNSLKWRMKTEPVQYERAKRQYLETMQDITISTTTLYFSVLSAQSDYEKSRENLADRQRLYELAQRRHELTGANSRSEIMQLELSLLNAEMSVNTSRLNLETQLFQLCLYLGMTRLTDLRLAGAPDRPDLSVSAEEVIRLARENSTHPLSQELKQLSAEQAVAQAKSAKGLQMQLRANLGLSQTGTDLSSVYHHLREREVVGLTFQLPIYDWGLSRGREKMALADLDVTRAEIEQEEMELDESISTMVARFNNQSAQCDISLRARKISEERYELTKKRFEDGAVTVTDLNTAQSEYESAENQYISQMRQYWVLYYQLQKTTLYDFIRRENLGAEFDQLIK